MWWILTALGEVVIEITQDISQDFGFSFEDFQEKLRSVSSETPVTVRINSDGGSVFQGLAIYNALRMHKGQITTINEGIAGSIAGVIFLAGDIRRAQQHSFFMGHFPSLGARGRTKDMQSAVELIKRADAEVEKIYRERTRLSTEQITQMIDQDVWLTAEESIQSGVATEILEVPDVAAHAKNLKSLVAQVQRGVYKMDFATWLSAYCKPLGLEVDKLTDEQKKNLEAKYNLEAKGTKTPLTSTVTPPPRVPAGTVADPLVATVVDTSTTVDDPQARLAAANQLDADRIERNDNIELLARTFDGDLSDDYCKSLQGFRGKTVKALSAHAIRNNWSVDKFELELHRGAKPEAAPAIHVAPDRSMNYQALTCSLLRNANIPETAEQATTKKKYGLAHWFDEKTLNESDAPHIRDTSLCQILEMAYIEAYGSRPKNRYGSPGFIQEIRGALRYHQLQAATGNTTWTGLNIFDDAANKMLWAAYEAQNTTWQEWVRTAAVTDFKTVNMYRMTMTGGYQQVGADGELKHGGLTDDKYTLSVDTYGKIVGMNRTDLINDDLGALNTIMTALGIEGARFLEELFYVHLMNNLTTLFPTDGSNKNYISGAGTVLGVDGLTTAEQKFSDQVDGDNAPLLTQGDILLHGTANGVKAAELYTQTQLQGLQTANAKNRPDGNPHVGKFRPVTTGYLNNTNIKVRTKTSSLAIGAAIPNQTATQWLLLGNPNRAQGAVVVGGFLNGQQRPTIEQADAPFDVLGLQWRAYHDAGSANGDPKFGVHSKGAA